MNLCTDTCFKVREIGSNFPMLYSYIDHSKFCEVIANELNSNRHFYDLLITEYKDLLTRIETGKNDKTLMHSCLYIHNTALYNLESDKLTYSLLLYITDILDWLVIGSTCLKPITDCGLTFCSLEQKDIKFVCSPMRKINGNYHGQRENRGPLFFAGVQKYYRIAFV